MIQPPLDRLARAVFAGPAAGWVAPRTGPPGWLIYAQLRPGRSRYDCQCQIGKDGPHEGRIGRIEGIGSDELNNELQPRQITATGAPRLGTTNRNLIRPRPPSATLRPPHERQPTGDAAYTALASNRWKNDQTKHARLGLRAGELTRLCKPGYGFFYPGSILYDRNEVRFLYAGPNPF